MSFQPDRRRLLQGTAAGAALSTFGAKAIAQSNLIPLEDFFKPSQISQLRLSPDGKSVLGVRQINKRDNLYVYDIASKKSLNITNFSDGDVTSPRWVSSDRILFGVQDRSRGSGDQFNTGLYAIDKDAKDFKELSERGFLSTDSRLLPVSTFVYSKGAGSGPDEFVVSVWSTGGGRVLVNSNLRRLNTRTGRSTLITEGGPGRVRWWGLDEKGLPRLAISSDDQGNTRYFYRGGEGASWERIAEFRWDDPGAWSPLALTADGKEIWVSAMVNTDFAGIYRYDLATRKLNPEPLLALKGYDLVPDATPNVPPAPGDPLIFNEKRELIGVRFHAERRGIHWLDESRANLQARLEATFPGRQVNWQGDPDKKNQPLLIVVSSDREPTQFMLYFQEQGQIQNFGSSRPWIKPERMSATEVYSYKARDGLTIPATLTVPQGKDPKNLPLIVLHYGGPWVRAIEWRYDSNVQFLASRGYAVMMPAPRGSTGFGYQHFRKGWKQWGLAMQDDVTDGVRDLIQKGIADPKRVCLAGASYGGYLTMMGLAKEPDMFKCGINWVGVTDPELMYIEWTDFAASESREVSLPAMLGHPKTDAEQFARTSPVKRAAEIKQPVLMAYGGSDRRVPIINGERMRAALVGHNPNVEWVVYPDEGHGWMRQDTTLDFWGRVERFLAKNL